MGADGLEVTLLVDDLTHPDVIALLEHHLVDFAQYSPAESMHALDLDGLRAPDVTFWSAWSGGDPAAQGGGDPTAHGGGDSAVQSGGELVGCGALKQLRTDPDGRRHGEIKSMRVADEFRGRGAGAAILSHLVEEARRRGYARLSLETGSPEAFAPARRLYARHGFVECAPFADYHPDPWSTFMTLDLSR